MIVRFKGFYIDPDLSKISVGIFTNFYTVKNYFDKSSISVRTLSDLSLNMMLPIFHYLIKLDDSSKSLDEESNAEISSRKTSHNLVTEGIEAGQRIAKISVVTLISIGVAELVTGYISGSVVATADGLDSISDATISFIVLLGLRIAHRPPDKKFHFGYHKVESFAALMASIGMVIIGVVIFYHSYQSLVQPHEIKQPILTMVVLGVCGCNIFASGISNENYCQ